LLLFPFAASPQARDEPVDVSKLRGPYLGQKAPGRVPEVFAQGVYYPGDNLNSVFSPDGTEFYFVTDHNGNDQNDVMWMRQVDGAWTPPEPAPFNSIHSDGDVCLQWRWSPIRNDG
jgi:hypothetical protein